MKGKKVLLVEDNEINQLVVTNFLKKLGAEIIIAENGKIAIDYVKEYKFNVVLMDLQMPVMGGLEATREIRKFLSNKDLPIIAMTAAVLEKDRDDSLLAGMDGFIAKPIDFKALQDIILKFKDQQINHNLNYIMENHSELNIFKDIINQKRLINLLESGLSINAILSITKGFANGHRNDNKKLDEFIAKNEVENAKRLFHTMAGISGNIGADKLYEISKKLENSENLFDDVESINKFRETLNNLISAIDIEIQKNISENINISENKLENNISLKEYLIYFKNKLESHEFISDDEEKQLKNYLKNINNSESYKSLFYFLENLDYENSLKIINELIKNI
jgi:CheY-like chemotaxis protein